MTFAERMDRATDPEELERLMIEVRKRGSDNWTLAAVKKRVAEDLWPLLEHHFDDNGSILEWTGENPPPRDARMRISILATVRALNAELREARESAAREHRERLEARRTQAEAEAAIADPDPGELLPEKPAKGEPPVIAVELDAKPPPAVDEEESEPVFEKPPKRKRRLVKRPEDLKRRRERPRPSQGQSDQANVRWPKMEAGTPKTESDPAEDARDPSSVPKEMPRPIEPDPVPAAFASHTFVEGWCSRCGLGREQASKYPCND